MLKAKSKPLWQVAILTASEADDAVTEFLVNLLGHSVNSYTNLESGLSSVSSYLARKPNWIKLRTRITEGLQVVRNCGLNTDPSKVSLRRVNHQNWAESWRHHFKPIEIGPGLLIKPSWSRHRSRKGQAVVVLDPGLSFGTGQHPTTSFCLKQIACRNGSGKSFLDMGTGSGILAIAAAKLGYSRVDAFDFDPTAIRAAKANARSNRCNPNVRIRRVDLSKLPPNSAARYDVVCANLISTLLVSERGRIICSLKPDGVLVLAGILANEFGIIETAYRKAGLELIESEVQNEWQSGAFCFERSDKP